MTKAKKLLKIEKFSTQKNSLLMVKEMLKISIHLLTISLKRNIGTI
jgi:hypothetical protein